MNTHFFQRMHDQDQSKIEVDQVLKKKLAHDLRLQSMGSRGSMSFFARLRSFTRPLGGFALATALLLVFFLVPHGFSIKDQLIGFVDQKFASKIDDWEGGGSQREAASFQGTGLVPTGGSVFQRISGSVQSSGSVGGNVPFARTQSSVAMESAPAPSAYLPAGPRDAKLGFSVGGAKDINNFRENITKGFLPLESDVTYEGLFYDYSFDPGRLQACNELFCPSYTRAFTRNPLTGQDEYYLSVGLNSNISESAFLRPKTNFVVVLDISGSMGSAFDQYYYDRTGKQVEIPRGEAKKSKMELASTSLNRMIDQLHPDDRLGVVLFSDDAKVAKSLRLVGESDLSALKRHILELKPTNGTNMSAGLKRGAELLKQAAGSSEGYANRLIFITDAMPNQGEFGAAGLHGLAQANAQQGISMTFVGVGLDFQTELVEGLSKVRGANYVSVHSAEEFERTLGKEFDFLVSPLVYDLRLQLEGSGFAIDQVYGSPDSDLSSGELMHVRTLFPSRTENGETRGGIILLKLRKIGEQPNATLRVTYEDTQGHAAQNVANISFEGMRLDTYDGNGVRKAVVLARYGELLKEWLRQENGPTSQDGRAAWERGPRPLPNSSGQRQAFQRFIAYFRAEAQVMENGFFGQSSGLQKEFPILEKLSSLQSRGIPYGDDGIVTPEPNPYPRPTDDWMSP